jgi:chromosome segregation ATPase
MRMCDRNPEKEAAFTFRWEWGEEGACCHEARADLEQLATNLGRRIEFHPLAPNAEPPLENAERGALKGRIFALEYDCADLQRARLELTAEVERLGADNRSLRLASSHAKQSYESLRKRADATAVQLEAALTAQRLAEQELAFTRENSKVGELESMAARNVELETALAKLEADSSARVFSLEAELAKLREKPVS